MIEPSDDEDDEDEQRHDAWLAAADWSDYATEPMTPDREN
jgi:hypothetical protein